MVTLGDATLIRYVKFMKVHFLYCIAADVPPVVPPTTGNFTIVWIVVGAVALLVVISVICLCGFLCLKRRKKHILDTGICAS